MIFGINRGQISTCHILTQKGTSLRDSAYFEQQFVKIRPEVCFLLFPRKKIVTRKLYFTRLPRSLPWTDFHKIWNERSSHRRNKTRHIVWICSRVPILQGVKISIFP